MHPQDAPVGFLVAASFSFFLLSLCPSFLPSCFTAVSLLKRGIRVVISETVENLLHFRSIRAPPSPITRNVHHGTRDIQRYEIRRTVLITSLSKERGAREDLENVFHWSTRGGFDFSSLSEQWRSVDISVVTIKRSFQIYSAKWPIA